MWTGLVLIFYLLTRFEFVPGKFRDRIISWFGAGFFLAFKGVNLLYGPFAAPFRNS